MSLNKTQALLMMYETSIHFEVQEPNSKKYGTEAIYLSPKIWSVTPEKTRKNSKSMELFKLTYLNVWLYLTLLVFVLYFIFFSLAFKGTLMQI